METQMPYPNHGTVLVALDKTDAANALSVDIECIGNAFGNAYLADVSDKTTETMAFVDFRATEDQRAAVEDAFNGLAWVFLYWGENSLAVAKDDLGLVTWEPDL